MTIPNGAAGTRQVLSEMASLARAGSRQMAIRNLAVQLVTDPVDPILQKDFAGEARVCLAYVRDHVRYVRDIRDVETLHDPVTVLRLGAGDCDDKAILLAALLLAIGHEGVRFVAVALDDPDSFVHVWVQDRVYGHWIDLEATEPIAFGQRVPLAGVVAWMTQDV